MRSEFRSHSSHRRSLFFHRRTYSYMYVRTYMNVCRAMMMTTLLFSRPHTRQSISVISVFGVLQRSSSRIKEERLQQAYATNHLLGPYPPPSPLLSSAPTRQPSFRVAALGIILTILFDPNILEILGAGRNRLLRRVLSLPSPS